MFKIGDRVQVKVPFCKYGKFGARGQIGKVAAINDDYISVVWSDTKNSIIRYDQLTWHKQTKQHLPPKQFGNCYSTCIAHVLGVPLATLPKFENMFGKKYNWSSILAKWLLDYNITVIEMKGHVQCSFPYIVSGYQDGKMIFDPAHSNKGVLSEDYTTFFADIAHLKKVIKEKYEKEFK